MTMDIHPDSVDPDAEFKNHIERLVMEARNAGVDDLQISEMLEEEAEAVEDDIDTSRLFG